MEIKQRIKIEQRIVRQIVGDALAENYSVAVSDGENDPVFTKSFYAIIKDLHHVDEEHLLIKRDGEARPFGSVFLVYGNMGWEVVGDYTDTPEINAIMEGANEIAEFYYNQSYGG
jgi:hypothetical protein